MSKKTKIKIVTKTGDVPAYETKGSAGMDIKANLKEDLVIGSLQRALIPTGLFIALPEGFEAQIRARSGLAIKNGISLANGVGTIDSDYRGEIKVALVNLSDEPFTVHDGDRIAQMVISSYEKAEWEITDSLDDTQRSSGGFGHTGV